VPISEEEMASNYGWALSVLKSNPELYKLFKKAVGPPAYGQAKFTAELRNTKWYKTHSESARQALVLQKADPSEYNRRVSIAGTAIADQYYALTGKKMSTAQANKYGVTAFTYGYNDAEIRDLTGNMVSSQQIMTKQGGIGGSLGQAEQQLRSAAEDYGLDFSDTYYAGALNNIARQQTDVTALTENFRNQAKSRYAAFADQLDQGVTIKDIAEPYRQLMAKTLEISDKSIKLSDKSIQNALTFRPSAGNKVQAPTGMNLADFERGLKNDPRWDKTNQARDQVMSAGKQVLTDLGFLGQGGN
jgi:hypothetical protein